MSASYNSSKKENITTDKLNLDKKKTNVKIDTSEGINYVNMSENPDGENIVIESNAKGGKLTVIDDTHVTTIKKTNADDDNLIIIEDPDDYLLYLETILKKIHSRFYKHYEENKKVTALIFIRHF